MKNLLEKIKSDIKQSLKSGNKERLKTLRYVLSLVEKKELVNNQALDDVGVLVVLQKEMKNKKESLALFEKAGRDDLITELKNEIKILSGYLPKLMNKEDIQNLVQKTINDTDSKDFGQIMGQVMGKVNGRADGKLVAQVVKEELVK